jgi:hypothetical protein
MKAKVMVLTRRVETKIQVIRGHRVILDSDLAELYGVPVKRLNEQVKRNAQRFPSDFVFQLKVRELRSQFATSNSAHDRKLNKPRGGRRYLPFAFTEHGAIMAATVLNSRRAVEMSIFVVRAFVRMRAALASSQKIIAKLRDIEKRVGDHDSDIREIMDAIREMMRPQPPSGRRIGFELPAAKA